MDKIERLLKRHLEKERDNTERTSGCIDEQALLNYLGQKIDSRSREGIEKHIAGCGFCLSQLSLVFEAKKVSVKGSGLKVPDELIKKAKALVKESKDRNGKKPIKFKKNLFLAGAGIFFVASFFFPKYFMQFLVVTLILGMRWAFESEGGRTLIMVFDSWRRHSRDEDDEISNRLKDKFKSPHL